MNERDCERIDAFLNGTLDAAANDDLQQLLRTDSEARRTLRRLAQIDAGLSELAAAGRDDFSSVAQRSSGSVTASSTKPRRNRRWALVGLAAAMAFLLAISFKWSFSPKSPTAQTTAQPVVARVADLRNCVWGEGAHSMNLGDAVSVETLRIESGSLEVEFSTGPRITLTGPAELRIESASAATLLAGHLGFRNDRPDSTFDLRTPYSELVDLGTSYEVALGTDFEEVHVFDGEVWRTAKNDTEGSIVIDAGTARRFGRTLPAFGQAISTEIAPSSSPSTSQSTVDNEARADFRTTDGNYDTATLPMSGTGWATPWLWHARNSQGDLVDAPLTVQHGEAVTSGIFYLQRRLAHPIRLADEGVTWFSVALQWDAAPDEPRDTFFVTLRSSDESASEPAERFVVPILSRRRNILLRFGGVSERREATIVRGEPLRLIGRIESHRTEPDRISVLLENGNAELPTSPPTEWTIVSRPVGSDGLLDLLVFHIQSTASIRISDVRLANTWTKLTAAPSTQSNR